jgi:hypothetical protein
MTFESTGPPLKPPILFLIFNRPALTRRVFETIREARPSKLYIAADGPRDSVQGEWEKCQQAREITNLIDWQCDVKTLFREENLGCGKGVSLAITWFFSQEQEGIILEDDCLPSPNFFRFCAELLRHYRHDTRIMGIGGTNLVPDEFRNHDSSYSFSNHNSIWGWATWKRAWDLYDYEMTQYKKVAKHGYLKKQFTSQYEVDYFDWVFEQTFHFPSITWDYQWEFVRRINSGLTILPQKNLVRNIGFGEDATHTTTEGVASSKLKLEELAFPLVHPRHVMADVKADRMAFIKHSTTFVTRLKSRVKILLPSGIRRFLFKSSMKRFISENQHHRREGRVEPLPEEQLNNLPTPTYR